MDPINAPHDISAEQKLPEAGTKVDSEPPSSSQQSKQRVPAAAKAWIILHIHGACCVALALAIALGLDGYEAGDKSSPHRVDGKLLLRVSDITTLISVALVVIKIVAGAWSTIVLWAFGRHMLTDKSASSTATVSKMIRWKLPPAVESLKNIPRNFSGWIISIAVVAVFIQAFISPVITGSVNWNTAFYISKKATSLSSVDPNADFSDWFWYNAEGYYGKKAYLRTAAGYTNIAWADTSTLDARGKSLSGNGCRHVVNDDGLPQNSILVDAILPCINVNSIRWYRNESEVVGDEWDISGDKLTLVSDDPFGYYRAGITVIYNTGNLRPRPDTSHPPSPNKFSGTMTVTLMVARRHYGKDYTGPPCAELPNTIFGNMNTLPYFFERRSASSSDENCFLIGKINFSAGVTKSSRAIYIGNRVVEDLTPIQDVVYEPDPWVQDAIWLLPDLVTMLAVSNVSQLSTFNNIDNYVTNILHQGYLGAWDMLSHSFNKDGPSYKAFPADARLVAKISFERVFVWLAVCLLMTVSGVFALGLVLKAGDLKPSEGNEKINKEGQGFMDAILDGTFG